MDALYIISDPISSWNCFSFHEFSICIILRLLLYCYYYHTFFFLHPNFLSFLILYIISQNPKRKCQVSNVTTRTLKWEKFLYNVTKTYHDLEYVIQTRGMRNEAQISQLANHFYSRSKMCFTPIISYNFWILISLAVFVPKSIQHLRKNAHHKLHTECIKEHCDKPGIVSFQARGQLKIL